MKQRFDLFAICLLIFAAILVTAMATDPKGFSVRDWQPLMAAFVALAAASLAYHAAMAKLDHDREVLAEERRRKALAVCLRLRFGAGAQKHDIDNLAFRIRPLNHATFQRDIAADTLIVRSQPAIEEAWENVDLFPADLALALHNMQLGRSNYELFKERYADQRWTLKPGEALPSELHRAHEAFSLWGQNSEQCIKQLLEFVRTELRRPV
ncbi:MULTISPECIES: hypothetical protein [Bradyrhizobium]|uniref:hypothetical protein n=1 Tax=Bradyrhizobium elkanii TaxID=29448 RepID=UPI00040B83A9|nr:hypothetical protein [Bradyrhizobium elkanii]